MADKKCLQCGIDIPASTDHSTDEPYMFVCNDCRDEIGNGGGYDPSGLPKDFTDKYHEDEDEYNGPTDDDGYPITEEQQERANHEQDRLNKGEY